MALPLPTSSHPTSEGSNLFGPNWPFSKPFNIFGPNGPPPTILTGLATNTTIKKISQHLTNGASLHQEVGSTGAGSVTNNGTSPQGEVISGGGASGFAPLGPILFGTGITSLVG